MVNFNYISIIVNSMLSLRRIIFFYYLSWNLKIDCSELNSLQLWIYQEYITYFESKKDINRRLYLKLSLDISNI